MSLPKRIIKETQRLSADPVPGIVATPHEDNVRYFDVVMDGPESSPFEGTSLAPVCARLRLRLPSSASPGAA